MLLLALSDMPLQSQLGHGSFSVKDFHCQEEHYFDYFWFLKLRIFFFFSDTNPERLYVSSLRPIRTVQGKDRKVL